jgi:hypothetical protein
MKKIFKIIGILFLILVVALIALPFIFKNKIIEYAKSEVNQQLNARVNFGDFDVSIFSSFPDFRLTVKNIQVIGKGDFSKDTLLANQELYADINLMSVIKGESYQINAIRLVKPNIKAIVLPDGRANWDIMKPDSIKKPETPSEPTKFKAQLKSLDIEDAMIEYADAPSNMSSKISHLNYHMEGDFSQDIFDMINKVEAEQLTFTYAGIPYLNYVKTKIDAALKMDLRNNIYTFKENEIGLNDLHLKVDGYVQMNEKNMRMDLKFNSKETDFKNILSLIPNVYTSSFKDVKTKGKLSLNGFAKGIYDDKTLPAFGAHLKVSDAMFQYPQLPRSVDNIQLDVNIDNPSGIPDATITDIKQLHLEMAGNPVDIKMLIKTPVSDPNVNGTIKGKINLSTVKDFVPMEQSSKLNGLLDADIAINGRMSSIERKQYEQFNAKGYLTIANMIYESESFKDPVNLQTMQLQFSPKIVDLKSFSAVIGNTDMQAIGTIENFLPYVFRDSTIKGNFTFTSKVIDVNRLMGTPSAAKQSEPSTKPMEVVGIPRNIDFTLASNIGRVYYDNLQLDNLSGKILIKNARLTLDHTKMNLLDGSMVMTGYYDTKNIKKPDVNYSLAITDFDIKKTFETFNTVKKLAPVAQYTNGKFSCNLDNFNGKLNSDMMPDLSSVSAIGNMTTKAVQLAGFEPVNQLSAALKMPQYKSLDVSNLKFLFELKDGKVNVKPFNLKLKNGTANIAGYTALDQSINYIWNFEVPRSEFGTQANNFADQLLSKANKQGVPIKMNDIIKFAVNIGGTITKPTITTNLKAIAGEVIKDLKGQATQVLEEKKQEVIADVKAKASAEVEKLIAQAKEQAEKIKAEATALSEKAIAESEKQAKDLENNGANVFEKLANKKLAEATRKEGLKKAKKITDEANTKSDAIINAAQQQADKLK